MTAPRLIAAATLTLAALLTLPAQSQTRVTDAWVRGTVAEQKATGAFMQLTSVTGGKLVSVSSTAAGVVEIHEMKMEGSTMQMRAIRGLDLPAGKPVALKPGSYHMMLLDLKAPLVAGSTVDLTLVVEGKDGKRETVRVKAPVRALGAAMSDHKH